MTVWMAGLLGLVLGPTAAAQQSGEDSVADAIALIESRYGERVDASLLWRSATLGVAGGLDAQLGVSGTAVLTREQHADAQRWFDGERHGIGLEFSILPGQGLLITDVFPGGPAGRVGVEIDDLVVAMNGHPFVGQPVPVIHTLVAQATSQTVVLEVRRGTAPLRRIAIERDRYDISSVKVQPMARSVPVLRIPFFGQGTARDLARALDENASDRRAVVLDVRDNAGGRLEEVIAAADVFLDTDATVVVVEGADGRRSPRRATTPRAWDGEVVLLVNPGTRGTAEAFAAALRGNGIARLVGTRTGGEDATPSFHELGKDLVLKLPEHTLLDPAGVSWRQHGLQPDIMVEPLQSSLSPPAHGGIADLQRDAALQLIAPR